jgi:predicted oxidoreductase
MQRIKFNNTLELSRIIYGMWRVGDDSDTSSKHVQAKIESCLEQGITSIDQADIYGEYTAEAIFGKALLDAPHLRDKLEIVTKCGIVAPCGRYADASVKHYNTSAQHINSSVEISLREMHTDRVDLLLIHRPDPFMDHAETGKALDALVQSGKVLHVGVSNFKQHDWEMLQSAMSTKLATNQIELSVLATDAFINGDVAFLQKNAVKPMAWSPLGGGALFDNANANLNELKAVLVRVAESQNVSMDAVAVAWLLAHPANIAPVMGTNNLDRIAKLSDAMNVEIDRQTWFEIYTASQGQEVP